MFPGLGEQLVYILQNPPMGWPSPGCPLRYAVAWPCWAKEGLCAPGNRRMGHHEDPTSQVEQYTPPFSGVLPRRPQRLELGQPGLEQVPLGDGGGFWHNTDPGPERTACL